MADKLDNLIRLKRPQAKAVAEMLSRAFFDDPLSVYFFPDEERRKAFQPQLMEYWLRHDVVYGEVYAISPKLEGIAAWVHSDKADRTLWRLLRNGAYFIKLDRETDEKRKIVHNLCAEMHNRHVTGPHWYLEFIGVEPALKGTGYASKLLRGDAEPRKYPPLRALWLQGDGRRRYPRQPHEAVCGDEGKALSTNI